MKGGKKARVDGGRVGGSLWFVLEEVGGDEGEK